MAPSFIIIDEVLPCPDFDEDCDDFTEAEAVNCWRYDPRGCCPLMD